MCKSISPDRCNSGVIHNYPLYKSVVSLSNALFDLIKKLEYVPIETNIFKVHECIEIISWYQPLISAKIARAFSSRESEKYYPEEYCSYDDKTSAFIVYNGLIMVCDALLMFANEKSLLELKTKLLKLGSKTLLISQQIPEEFNFEIVNTKN